MLIQLVALHWMVTYSPSRTATASIPTSCLVVLGKWYSRFEMGSLAFAPSPYATDVLHNPVCLQIPGTPGCSLQSIDGHPAIGSRVLSSGNSEKSRSPVRSASAPWATHIAAILASCATPPITRGRCTNLSSISRKSSVSPMRCRRSCQEYASKGSLPPASPKLWSGKT